jgi:hypothetical protein
MYVCMYVCMYVYTYVCMYVCIYVCMYVYTYVCMYAYVCRYIQVSEYAKIQMQNQYELKQCSQQSSQPSSKNESLGHDPAQKRASERVCVKTLFFFPSKVR